MRQTITVTEEDIANGIPDPGGCPIALAIQRAWPDLPASTSFEVDVACPDVTARIDESWRQGYLPEDACDFIFAFDQGQPVVPLTFELDWSDDEVSP